MLERRKELLQEQGFSLVELMVVIGIIGILTALALPRYSVYRAKAHQAEAKNNLSHIYTLEEAYKSDSSDGKYADLATIGRGTCPNPMINDIGFSLSGCAKSSYEYSVTGGDTFTATAASGAGTSNLVRRGCNADVWIIDDQLNLAATNDVTKTCDK